ncbi:MAG: Uma2 family endonuclease [Spirulinaceae cyanobacterium]
MQLQAKPPILTPTEYLEREETALERHEYRNGEVIKMVGSTADHDRIAGAFYRQFPTEIDAQNYEIFIGDMKLWIPATNLYTYPDIVVITGDPVYHQNRQDAIENPSLIVEVLSKSTGQYDQTDKFDAYRSIDTLKEYVMIDQYSYWVKQFVKNDQGQWVLTERVGAEAMLRLESISFAIPFADLYKRVQFAPNEANDRN